MKKSILEIYALLVCFSTVTCFVISLGITLYDVVKISTPEFTLNSNEYSRHQNNDLFWNDCGRYNSDKEKIQRPSEDELTKKRLDSYKLVIQSERRDASQSIVKALIIMLIDIIFFISHWHIARRARESNA